MIEENEAPTWEQRHQMEVGRNMALSAAVHALIASHPNPAAFSALLDYYVQETNLIFLQILALQRNNGLREAYSETVRGLNDAIPPG